MRNNVQPVAVKAPRRVPQNYDYALFRFDDGVTGGTSTTTAADANTDNSWELTLGNFDAAQWSTRAGYWSAVLASSYYAELTKVANLATYKKFFHRDAIVNKSWMLAMEFQLPAYATAAQRIIGAGVSNNDEIFNLRYLTGDLIAPYISGSAQILGTGIDITSYVDTDLVGVLLIDDRDNYKTAQFRLYVAGTDTVIDTASVSTAGLTWESRADSTEEYFTIGAKVGTHGNPTSASIRRVLAVPFGTSPPSDMTTVADQLAQSRITRFDLL